jgi:hypothetical protein
MRLRGVLEDLDAPAGGDCQQWVDIGRLAV